MSDKQESILITIQGIVQGVGFRPFIYNLANSLNIAGTVKNTSAGVFIEAHSTPEQLDNFYTRIQSDAPPLSRIDSIQREKIKVIFCSGFSILESEVLPGAFSIVPPDMATCPDCFAEMFDPHDRRFRYPFINCTNCGPRFSIIRRMPYDRPSTSMEGFPLCPECKAEYDDPFNRRFHAQPIACPTCGPHLSYYQNGNLTGISEDALQKARDLIKTGGILALKGIGGYQLVCDAHNTNALDRLRSGKLRSSKPFALMAWDKEIISEYCSPSENDERLLSSPQHPIVILQATNNKLQHNAPGQNTLGFMLPYTPLHYLITEPQNSYPDVLVMTSGNISEEPMLIDDIEAQKKLAHVADGFLGHNRPILNRVDDSVMKTLPHYYIPIRRARGYSPDPVIISEELPEVYAAGALLKNTFTLVKQKQAFVSHFIGDLDNLETYRDYEISIDNYFKLFQFTPQIVACDEHPDFLSTQFAESLACNSNLQLLKVQHHHAHLAACLAENKQPLDKAVIGLCYDGTGYGTDGAIWGGEILLGNALEFQRKAHLEYLPLPGGDQAIKKPYRILIAYLHALNIPFPENCPTNDHCSPTELQVIHSQVDKKLNIVNTSSMGRLFDAAAALIGVRQEISYEGQAAIEMEALADPDEKWTYPFSIEDGIIQVKPLFMAIIEDQKRQISKNIIAARFHNTVANLSKQIVVNIMEETGCKTVALSGGVWQNSLLMEITTHLLNGVGVELLLHRLLPPNDGCVSLGQAVVAGMITKRKK